MFDPHEPWDPPESYAARYHDNYPCKRPIIAYDFNNKDVPAEDVEWIRALYAAEVSLVDRWIGYLLETIEHLGLFEDTMVVFTSDHGTEFGEHGYIQKEAHLLHPPVVQLPLLISTPNPAHQGKRAKGLVSALDFLPTMLDCIEVEGPNDMQGASAMSLVDGTNTSIRDFVATGFQGYSAVRDLEWNFIFPVVRGKDDIIPKRLYHTSNDPLEQNNVIDDYPDVKKRMEEMALEIWPRDQVYADE